jgi:hypothetical protein
MSFDLVVLTVEPRATDAEVRAMADICRSPRHPEGNLDERVVSFYENLSARYPDCPPVDDDSPWMDTPLNVGIDHVGMHAGALPLHGLRSAILSSEERLPL